MTCVGRKVMTRKPTLKQDADEIEPRTRLRRLHAVARNKASQLMPKALAYLETVVDDEEAPHGARLKAAEMILDRALGKAKEFKEITGNMSVTHQHLDALRAINRAAEAGRVLDLEVVPNDGLPVYQSGKQPNNNNSLLEYGRQSEASIGETGASEDATELVEEAPPSSGDGG